MFMLGVAEALNLHQILLNDILQPVLLSKTNKNLTLTISFAEQNMATAIRKGGGGGHGGGHGGGRGGGRGARGDSNGSSSSSSSSPYGKAIPLITEGSVLPKSLGASSHKHKHNSAHSGYSFSIATLLIVSAFWLDSLACLCSF
ncbi:putative uncharacterized protein DDB_G0287183 isoform X1 [Dendrobium catenatum]|uniref:putative uncharacterized protein DDB_G0287183 isoform X1 n=1 Tax=Dendrobium catenatum TaxID=906689 RepID=UPI0010A03421|nr:putative uncharacterized protein DDB_G0287183 isoform X1 [Dendrobium catenatum]